MFRMYNFAFPIRKEYLYPCISCLFLYACCMCRMLWLSKAAPLPLHCLHLLRTQSLKYGVKLYRSASLYAY